MNRKATSPGLVPWVEAGEMHRRAVAGKAGHSDYGSDPAAGLVKRGFAALTGQAAPYALGAKEDSNCPVVAIAWPITHAQTGEEMVTTVALPFCGVEVVHWGGDSPAQWYIAPDVPRLLREAARHTSSPVSTVFLTVLTGRIPDTALASAVKEEARAMDERGGGPDTTYDRNMSASYRHGADRERQRAALAACAGDLASCVRLCQLADAMDECAGRSHSCWLRGDKSFTGNTGPLWDVRACWGDDE